MEIAGLVMAFGAGIFGAALGGLLSFVFVGAFVLVAVAAQAGGGDLVGIAFGGFGPHAGGFAAGVAGAAYAAKKGKMENGRDIGAGLMGLGSPDVLVVGGVFGVVGYLINWAFGLVGFPWTDTVALTVVVSAIIVRLIWGNGLFGQVADGVQRFAPPVESRWVGYQSTMPQILLIGLGAGIFGAWTALHLGADNMGAIFGFGISAFSLIALFFGVNVPVTHHITLLGAITALASGSIIWGVVFAMASAVVAEFGANLFLVHGDTHIDPPAFAIAIMTSVMLLCQSIGLFSIPMPF